MMSSMSCYSSASEYEYTSTSPSDMTLCTHDDPFSAVHYDDDDADDVLMEFEVMLGGAQLLMNAADEAEAAEAAKLQEIDQVYEHIEEDAMMDILKDIETELMPAYLAGELTPSQPAAPAPQSPAREEMLWHLTATPDMMRGLAAHVAAQPAAIAAR